MVKDFLQALKGKEYRDMLVHHQIIPASPPSFIIPKPPLPGELQAALKNAEIDKLFSHQAEALNIVRSGANPVIITPTASGKTLAFNIPIIEYFLAHEGGRALYLFPLKALEQDQLKQLTGLIQLLPPNMRFGAAVYDGDTPQDARAKIKADFPRVLMTNPEMLNLAVSAYHRGWSKFLRELKFIVVDELHTYKGIFGSHMAQLFRRINRICRHYGSDPQYIACSATIANPVQLAENLTGKPFQLVEQSGAPMAKRHYVFLNPEISVNTIASRLFRLGIELGLKTIVFTKARKITELIYHWVLEAEPQLERRISAYRAGFLPAERREIEAKLNSGALWGVISTSALEMGIDIGSLDLCILVGYPGTISAAFQRGGRVGRKTESVVVMVAQQNALDQYFMRNPDDFFGRPFEAAVVDKENRYILSKHIQCAAAEIPIDAQEEFYSPDKYDEVFAKLKQQGLLKQSADGKRWFSVINKPQRGIDLRASGVLYTITDIKGRIIGSVSGSNVFTECHPGAVYLHMGKQYLVRDLDFKNYNVAVKQVNVSHYTSTRSQKHTEIISTAKSRELKNFTLHQGEVRVTEWITGYEKRKLFSQELMGTYPLDLPEQSYETIGIWMQIPKEAAVFCNEKGLHFMGGLHGTEHALLSLVPLFAICDRSDMGGISLVEHNGADGPAIFLYDGYPGGVGLAERIYDIFEKLIEKTLKLVADCPCDDGCPSCIHSPKCGSGNYPLDKRAVLALMTRFAGEGDFSIEDETAVIEAPAPEPIQRAPIPQIEPEKLKTILIFDLETQLSADDVGGWKNIKDMRLAAGVTMEIGSGKYRIYYEEDAKELIAALKRADLVVGFNLLRFDYTVLELYGLDARGLKTLDLMVEIQKVLGHLLSLDALCRATLKASKSAAGLQSVEWFKQGKLDLVTDYCLNDVRLTKDLYLFGEKEGYVMYSHSEHGLTRIPVEW
ncbi:MAG: DEAD/DEAH box helicase [candidate division Zixibacteria bacterium]|nr:DEAD/DEAH box helicase [Candidatus Tariuqbacter arcticus]